MAIQLNGKTKLTAEAAKQFVELGAAIAAGERERLDHHEDIADAVEDGLVVSASELALRIPPSAACGHPV